MVIYNEEFRHYRLKAPNSVHETLETFDDNTPETLCVANVNPNLLGPIEGPTPGSGVSYSSDRRQVSRLY